ncbi:MAG: hypothetical protein M0R03_16175 [Novosphingobium sp.]|nr:hypothetical protein [Novosphingobium sp.]
MRFFKKNIRLKEGKNFAIVPKEQDDQKRTPQQQIDALKGVARPKDGDNITISQELFENEDIIECETEDGIIESYTVGEIHEMYRRNNKGRLFEDQQVVDNINYKNGSVYHDITGNRYIYVPEKSTRTRNDGSPVNDKSDEFVVRIENPKEYKGSLTDNDYNSTNNFHIEGEVLPYGGRKPVRSLNFNSGELRLIRPEDIGKHEILNKIDRTKLKNYLTHLENYTKNPNYDYISDELDDEEEHSIINTIPEVINQCSVTSKVWKLIGNSRPLIRKINNFIKLNNEAKAIEVVNLLATNKLSFNKFYEFVRRAYIIKAEDEIINPNEENLEDDCVVEYNYKFDYFDKSGALSQPERYVKLNTIHLNKALKNYKNSDCSTLIALTSGFKVAFIDAFVDISFVPIFLDFLNKEKNSKNRNLRDADIIERLSKETVNTLKQKKFNGKSGREYPFIMDSNCDWDLSVDIYHSLGNIIEDVKKKKREKTLTKKDLQKAVFEFRKKLNSAINEGGIYFSLDMLAAVRNMANEINNDEVKEDLNSFEIKLFGEKVTEKLANLKQYQYKPIRRIEQDV